MQRGRIQNVEVRTTAPSSELWELKGGFQGAKGEWGVSFKGGCKGRIEGWALEGLGFRALGF